MKYRAELDGLRALAVVPVILFHAGFEIFSGGFVGVDVFFVISGYLITSILIDEIENGRFSILNFYERRARRIMPALFFVMLSCIPFAWIWMPSTEFRDFSQSLVAVSLFISNILFWRESGYFAGAAEEKPLLHTWSLAVEEQYYLLFPIFLFFAWRHGKDKVFWMIIAVTALSLTLSEWGWRNSPTANFYLAPTRAWEILAGSIAAFVVQKRGVSASNPLSLLGLVAIIFSVFAYDEGTPFPSLYTLVPVLGVVLLVRFGGEGTLAAKLLSTKAFVGMGLISYSAYLWHQPLFAFARIQALSDPSASLMTVLSLTSILLAAFSWKFVEQPFRSKGRSVISRKGIFAGTVVGIVMMSGAGYVGQRNSDSSFLRPKESPNIEYTSLGQKRKLVGEVCELQNIDGSDWVQRCDFGDIYATERLVLIGDSHADAISYSLDELLRERNVRGIRLGLSGCETVPYIHRDKRNLANQCGNRFQDFLTYLNALDSDVLLISRWSFKLYPIKGFIEDMPYMNSEGHREKDAEYREYDALRNGSLTREADDKAWALSEFIRGISLASKRLILVYPIPETGINIARFNRFMLNKTGNIPNSITMNANDYDDRNSFVIEIFDRLLVDMDNIEKISPKEIFCNSSIPDRCVIQENSIPYYYDDDHVSKQGADLIVQRLRDLENWR